MPRSLLLLLSQFTLDPSSGAVRSLRTIAQLLAAAPHAFRVRALATTASDAATPLTRADIIRIITAATEGSPPTAYHDLLSFTLRSVHHTILDTGHTRTTAWHDAHGPRFDELLTRELTHHTPDAVLTMGAGPHERTRHALCRAHNIPVVLAVRNHGYYDPRAFEHADAVLTPSNFLRSRLLDRAGIDSTALPTPIEPDETIVPPAEHQPIFITFVNPTRDKGVMLVARLAEELATRRPDLPLLIVESRAAGGSLVAAGLAALPAPGFDLRRHASIMLSPHVPAPRDFLAHTRILLAPSLWDEPSGRVAAEALVNGIPPLVSDRGGLPETVGVLGALAPLAEFVIPVPPDLTPNSTSPPPAATVAPWLAAIERLCDDPAAYSSASTAARDAGRAFLPEALAPRYAAFFSALRKPRP